MKTTRQAKILELIQKKDVETQEELSAYLEKEGFQVTQATVSRDIRELKLTKISTDNGRQKYAVITDADSNMMEKYARVLREGFLSVDAAENIVVIKTMPGLASAACAFLAFFFFLGLNWFIAMSTSCVTMHSTAGIR